MSAQGLSSPSLLPFAGRRRAAFGMAAVLSVFLHAGSLYAIYNWHTEQELGAISVASEAISVELVASQTIETLQARQVPEPASVQEATAPTEGRTEASNKETKAEREVPDPAPEITVPAPPFVLPKLSEELAPAMKAETPVKAEAPPLPDDGIEEAPEPPNKDTAERKTPPKPARRRETEEKRSAERAPKGGTTSKAQAGRGSGGERASASTGAILTYAARLRARLAANKPSGRGQRGTTTVSFGVTQSGGLAFASISRSSGNRALDELAVSAVRRAAPFPAPPPGATTAQLRFSIPFYFE